MPEHSRFQPRHDTKVYVRTTAKMEYPRQPTVRLIARLPFFRESNVPLIFLLYVTIQIWIESKSSNSLDGFLD